MPFPAAPSRQASAELSVGNKIGLVDKETKRQNHKPYDLAELYTPSGTLRRSLSYTQAGLTEDKVTGYAIKADLTCRTQSSLMLAAKFAVIN